MIYSGNVNGSSLTTNDLIVICGGAESYSGTQAFTVNGTSVTQRVAVTAVQSPNQYAGTYVGTVGVSSGMSGDSTLTVAQTTNPGSGNSFRAGCGVFRLVNGNIHSVISDTQYYSESTATGPRTITRSVTASSDQIIFIAAHCGQGAGSTATLSLSTNNGTITRYEGVTESFGNSEYAVITGSTNPTIRWATTNSGATQGMSISAMVIGY
jgi:hypothetical protein